MESKTLFVDTGAWLALADKSDGHHKRAVEIYPELLKDSHHLTTTNLVVAETYVLIRRLMGHQPAMTFLQNISASPRVVKINSDRTLEETAESILSQYKDQNFSYTDAVSFAVMKDYEIKQAFTFDQHFFTAGFIVVPQLSSI